MKLKRKFSTRFLVFLCIVVLFLGGVVFILFKKDVKKNTSVSLSSVTNSQSVYPTNPPITFGTIPLPPDALKQYDPYKQIQQLDQDQANLLNTNDQPVGAKYLKTVQGPILPSRDMNIRPESAGSGQPYMTVWLNPGESFKAVSELVPYFSSDFSDTQTFIVKAFLDGQAIRLGIRNKSLDDQITLRLKNGEKSLIEFETEPLAIGVHSLNIIGFDFAYDNNPNPDYQASYNQNLRSYSFKLYVGTAKSNQEPVWNDWSYSKAEAFNTDSQTSLIDLEKTNVAKRIAYWGPDPFQSGQNINYNIGIFSNQKGDKEYCLIALLDYKVVPIQAGQNLICGTVRNGEWGVVNANLDLPKVAGVYHLEVLAIENPNMKSSYLQTAVNGELFHTMSSGRVLITVQ